MHKMIAQSDMRYGTRRLRAGDAFDVDNAKHATALEAVGKARPAKPAAEAYPKVPAHDEITMLRAEYERVKGKRPFMGWDEAMLREKIAAA